MLTIFIPLKYLNLKTGFFLKSFVLIFVLCFGVFSYAAHACQVFRPSLQLKAPPQPEISIPNPLPMGWEESLLHSIDSANSDHSFSKIYLEHSKNSNPRLSDNEKYKWLSCLSYYFNWQHAQDSSIEWTAVVDDRPSRILYPLSIDKELGLDRHYRLKGIIPLQLRFPKKRKEEAYLQQKLFKEFGILALDHTDQHSVIVLKEFIFLLNHSFDKNFVRRLPSLRYLYAFTGHDFQSQVAAYHHQLNSISVGGVSNYPSRILTAHQRFALVAALAHEIGHAFLFDHVSPEELKKIATEFGNWEIKPGDATQESLFSPVFFQVYSQHTLLENLPSEYSSTNIHEWFAESFAAKILIGLVESGHFGKDGGRWLGKYTSQQAYWTHYKNLNPAFNSWLVAKMNDAKSPNRRSVSVLQSKKWKVKTLSAKVFSEPQI